MADQPIPQFSVPVIDPVTGRMNRDWYTYLSGQQGAGALADATSDKALKAQDWSESLIIEFPDDGDYVFPGWFKGETVTSVITECDAGTCTLTVKIGSTALGGTANSVSTSRDTEAHSTNNVSADGDDLVLTVSANSSCERMSVTLRGTRTLA